MKESDIINGLIMSLGRKEYSVSELKQLCEPFGITDSSLRTWLSRKVKQGFLSVRKEGKASYYGFAQKGRRIVSNISRSFETPDWSDWDGGWCGFAFSIPEKQKTDRHRIRTKLSAYRFAPWYSGFWIRPKHEAEGIDKHFSSAPENTYGHLITFYPMKEITPGEVRQLWNVDQLQQNYIKGVETLREDGTLLEKLTAEEAHVKRIEVGNSAVPLIFQDPLLPAQFLPTDWMGNEFKTAFFQWDEAITSKAKPFWIRVLGEPQRGDYHANQNTKTDEPRL